MQSLYETYHNMYYDENNFYNDVVEFCEELNIFESSEESEYFANLIIENDLGLTFVEDIVEYCEQGQVLNESYIAEVSAGLIKAGIKAAGGVLKKITPAVRGLSAKTLVKKGYTPGGFDKTGNPLLPQARAPQARASRAARDAAKAANPPSSQLPNFYGNAAKLKAANALPAASRAKLGAPSSKPGTVKIGGEVKPTSASTGAFPTRPGGATPRGGAEASSIRAARTRATSSTPQPLMANRYADQLASKKAKTAAPTTSGGTFAQRGWERHAAAGGPSPQKIAQRAAADPTILATMLGVAQMAGLPVGKAISSGAKAVAPIVRSSIGKIRSAPKVSSTAQDPWKAVTSAKPKASVTPSATPKPSTPKQLAGSGAPKGLLSPAKTPKAPTATAQDPWKAGTSGKTPKQFGIPKEGPSSRVPNKTLTGSGAPKGLLSPGKVNAGNGKTAAFNDVQNFNQKYGGLVGSGEAAKPPSGAPKPAWGPGAPKPEPRSSKAAPEVILGPRGSKVSADTKKPPTPPSSEPPTPPTPPTKAPYKHVSSRGSGPFRATGPSGGNATIERLANQTARTNRGTVPPKGKINGPGIAAGLAGAAALTADSASNKDKKPKYDVYNTQDPSGNVRDRLKVGPKIVGPKIVGNRTAAAKEFDAAYAKAKKTKGMGSNFDWRGKDYGVY